MTMIEPGAQLTPRESLLMEYEREENRLAREFALASKDKEIALAKLEVKWASWLRIPLVIIKLPIVALWVLLYGTAHVVSVARKQPLDISEMWRQLK